MSKDKLSRGILFSVTIAFWFSQYGYTPYVNPQLIMMGVTASVMGIIGGAYGFTQFILRIPIGISSDRWQRKFFVCAGSLCTALASLCMFVFHNPIGFLVGRALGGVGASSWVPCTVLYTSYYKPEHATRSITTINVANNLGRVVSYLMAAFITARFGQQSAFILCMIGGFSAFVISLIIREDKALSTKIPLTIRELLAVGSERNLLITSFLGICVQLITFATITSFTSNHAVGIGASSAQLGIMYVALLLPGIILGFCLSKFILLKVDAKTLVVLGFLFSALYCSLVTFTTEIWQLYIVQILGGIGSTLTFSLLMGISVLRITSEKRGAAMGFYQALYGIGMTLGPVIMGLVTDALNLRIGFILMAGIAVLSSATAAVFLKKTGVISNS